MIEAVLQNVIPTELSFGTKDILGNTDYQGTSYVIEDNSRFAETDVSVIQAYLYDISISFTYFDLRIKKKT